MKIPYGWLKEYVSSLPWPKELAALLTLAGHALDKPLYDQGGDTIIEVEDRGNRADVLGLIGLARDVSALTEASLKEIDRSLLPAANNESFKVKINVQSPLVLRFSALILRNLEVKASPDYIRERLKSYGLDSINNVVDVTNYVMIETGMPLHAFDLRKVEELNLRLARKGETLLTFDGSSLKLSAEDLVAADSTEPLSLASAIGGRGSGVSEKTKGILLEAGLYDPAAARRTALRHNIRNETTSRLGKHLHPDFVPLALGRSLFLLKEIFPNLKVEPFLFDYYPNPYPAIAVFLSQKRLGTLAGEDISQKEAENLLTRLGLQALEREDGQTEFFIPYFRTDLRMEDDLIEEVLRLRGYERIPSRLISAPSPPKLNFPLLDLEEKIRDLSVRLGFNEVVSQQIIDEEETKKAGLYEKEKVVRLTNSWNKELNILRPELTSPSLKYALAYEKQGGKDTRIFEIGKTYEKDDRLSGYGKYKEIRNAAFTVTSDFLSLKSYLEALFFELGLKKVIYRKSVFPSFKKEKSASLFLDEVEIGRIGEVKNAVGVSFGLHSRISHAVLRLEPLIKIIKETTNINATSDIINYINEDYTLILPEEAEVGPLLAEIEALVGEDSLVSLKNGEIYRGKTLGEKKKKSLTIRVSFNSQSRKTKERISRLRSFLTGRGLNA